MIFSSWTRSTASTAAVEEILYPAMEDYAIDIIIGKGPSAQFDPAGSAALYAHRSDDARRAADRAAARPLRCRQSAAGALPAGGAAEDRRAQRRYPRVDDRSVPARMRSPRARAARRALPTVCCKRVRDYAQVRADGVITTRGRRMPRCCALEVDELGLDATDRRMLRSIIRILSRRAGRAGNARRDDRRRGRDARGRLRAVSAAAWVF